jgi:DNA-binding transcriptional LysR family regulator
MGEQWPMRAFDGMEVFAAVVEAGNFTAAGRALGVSKSSLSERVAALEARLGVRLLERTTRRLRPTEAGRLFYERCKRALGEAEAAVAEAQALMAEPAGRLRVASPELFTRLHLVPEAVSFLARNPRLEIEFVESTEVADLIKENLDLAIRIMAAPSPTHIVRRLATAPVVIAAAPAYLSERKAPAHPEEIAQHRCVGFTPLHWAREWRFEGQGKNSGGRVSIPVEPYLLTNSTESLRAAAIAGAGLVAAPLWALADAIQSGALRRVLEDWRTPEAGIFAVYPSNRLLTPKVRLFVDHVARALRGKGL